MKRFFLLFILLQSFFIFSQEMGSIDKGEHSLKLFKHDHFYSISFSLDETDAPELESAFIFPKKETILSLIENGFIKKINHQLIVKTNQDTIVKFEFRKFNGSWFLKFKRNDLLNNQIYSSTFFKKEKVLELFKSTTNS